MEPTQPPQDSPPPQQGWPAPGPHTPGPYGPPAPYGPYGTPYGPGPGPYGTPSPGTNGLAVGSLVSGILCCLPPLGLVLGLIALPQIKKRRQTGKGLAVAGIVLSSISSLLMVVGLVTGGFGQMWTDFKAGMEDAARSQSALSLRTGQCYDVDGELESDTSEIGVVDCAGEHEGEVTGTFPVTGFTGWPGEKPLDRLAGQRCEEIGYAYAWDSWAIPEDIWTYYHLPTRESWRAGDRTVTCSFVSEGAPVKGSLRNDETTLDAHQAHFLKSLNPVDIAVFAEPEEPADKDLKANTAWAAEVRDALTAASKGLKGHRWPGASAAPVAEMVKELDAAAEEWDELAKASDEDAFWEHYDTAYDLTTWGAESKARAALGLAGQRESGTSSA
ncbi:DUF4190 domain-containing protein [Streptomyces sp. NPDC006551]|uniref:DUF4190 domain-containing protein n=1 Tax=Streptomyces sp. NPDC006551 TaxID=3157178 RepID=UPI0033BBFC13